MPASPGLSSHALPAPSLKSWRIADFQDTILSDEDGSAVVKERINLVFIGQWHGIHRTIPIEYPGPRGTNYTLFLDVTSVTDGAGQKLKYEIKTSGGYRDLKIYIPGAVDTPRARWRSSTSSATASVISKTTTSSTGMSPATTGRCRSIMPKPTSLSRRKPAGMLRAQAFTGVYGSAERDATSEVNGADVAFETTNPLPMRGGMTIDIFIPKGILKEPGALTRAFLVSGQQSDCVFALRYLRRDVRAVVVQGARSRSRAFGRAHV